MSWASDFHFTVDPEPKTDVFAPKSGWSTTVPPVAPWSSGGIANQKTIPAYQTDENLKKLYGIELAKTNNPWEAAKTVIGHDDRAVWVSLNWLADPIVIASKDAYLKTLEEAAPPLDREQLAAKVLALAEGEKIDIGGGVKKATIEAKDRISAFKLYSEILGYTGKVEIDNSTNNNVINNELKIVLVKPEQKKVMTINEAPNVKSEILNSSVPSPVSLKLVKAS